MSNSNDDVFGGALEIFMGLPAEILASIFCVHESVLLSCARINHHFSVWLSKEILIAMCAKPITTFEILAEIDARESVVMVAERHEDFVLMHQCDYDMNDGVLCGFDYWECNNCEGTICFVSPDSEELDRDDLGNDVELFSEHRLLWKRAACITFDPGFANRRLVERYNKEVAPDLSSREVEKISPQDAMRTLMITYSADNGIDEDEFDFKDQADVDRLVKIFTSARLTVRNHVMRETGAMISVDNEYVLVHQ